MLIGSRKLWPHRSGQGGSCLVEPARETRITLSELRKQGSCSSGQGRSGQGVGSEESRQIWAGRLVKAELEPAVTVRRNRG